MSETGAAVARHARTLIGAPFRLHGRSAEFGVDCLGLVELCSEAAGLDLDFRATYGLRNGDISAMLEIAETDQVLRVDGSVRTGDILLVSPGPAQHHLLIITSTTHFVHAHAGLRRVVETPLPSPWSIRRHWRFL